MGIPTPYKFPLLTGDGQTTSIVWPGGRGIFTAQGTWGSGTAKLQVSHDDEVTWIDVDRSGDTYVTFTANGQGGFELGKCALRVSLSGSTAPRINAGLEAAYQ